MTLYFQPISFAAVSVLSVIAAATLMGIKFFIIDTFHKRLLSEKPLILVVEPESGKGVMECITPADVKTEILPYVGRIKFSDISLGQKDFRMVCFHSMAGRDGARADRINLLDHVPHLVVFAAGAGDLKKQGEVFWKTRKMFPHTPSLAVMNARLSAQNARTARKIFGRHLLYTPSMEDGNTLKIRSTMEKQIFRRAPAKII